MNPRIIQLPEKKLIGMKSKMHHGQFGNIVALWKRFMPNRITIKNTVNNEFIALQEYSDFKNFDASFNIWASVEVSDIELIPEGMHAFAIPEGTYAVFLQKGMDAGATYQGIMTEWLPSSGYAIDDRPHFQVMGDKYKNGSEDSEEDFYVPIKSLNF
ncbi:GyrI-like domain-containing protein [Winogradskyella immobilis]|uniref:GyrI-like domain-containing protein n=1 Tax=Winogradskyella immobilis TaxID=2816852 RepID=A0ABS8EP51_9FLAO|nr:GyrI-like domain-containing protein [Winogradskyella immobilis]MCC1484642.1 GyrI-like domain-containing protein [Winogradskyella immobilis]MCG0016734.1 GyrI-like domain-containing protein [Winogradskyella immobilis]